MKCKRCQREWSYKGGSPYYTTCPVCKTSINVRKSIVFEADNPWINSNDLGGAP